MGTRLVLALSVGLVCIGAVAADSIYPVEKKRTMIADRRAQAVGDIVTVVITESTTAVQSANLDVKRSGDSSANGGSGLWGVLKLVPRASVGGSTSQQGAGSTSRTSKLVTNIACRIVEVLPGGQLLLRGDRSVKINDDLQTLRFTGTARPDDVAPDNTLLSGAVADAKIEVFGKGPVDHQVKPGLLSRIVGLLF